MKAFSWAPETQGRAWCASQENWQCSLSLLLVVSFWYQLAAHSPPIHKQSVPTGFICLGHANWYIILVSRPAYSNKDEGGRLFIILLIIKRHTSSRSSGQNKYCSIHCFSNRSSLDRFLAECMLAATRN